MGVRDIIQRHYLIKAAAAGREKTASAAEISKAREICLQVMAR